MKVYIALVLVVIPLLFHILFCEAGRSGSSSRDDRRPHQVNEGLGSCQAQGRSSRTLKNRIIRTKDSIDNGACFADAITVDSIDECSDRCCSYSGTDCNSNCDTSIFVHEAADEVNCFLFVCGDDDVCKFSYHSGYTTTQHSYHRERIEQPLTTSVPATTASQHSTTLPLPTTNKALPTTTVIWELPTTQKEIVKPGRQHKPKQKNPEEANDIKKECKHFEFQCGSGECYKFSYVCDGIIDCKDNSDETGCDYATTVDDSPITTSAPQTGLQSTQEIVAENLKVHSPGSSAGLSSQDVALESKNDIPSKHGEKSLEGGDRVLGNTPPKVGVSGSDVVYKEPDSSLTQELQNKGHERNNEPDDQMNLTDLQNDLHALSGNDGGKDWDDGYEKEKYQKTGGKSEEYDKNEDNDRDGGRMWGYDKGVGNQQLAEDLYGTKSKDEESLEDMGRGQNKKKGQDMDNHDAVEDKTNDRKQSEDYAKEEVSDAVRDDSGLVQHESFDQNEDDDDRAVHIAVGRKLDNVEKLPHARKNGRLNQKTDGYDGNNRQITDHTDDIKFESSQRSDKGNKGSTKEKWQHDMAKNYWDGRSYIGESIEDHDNDKELIRDKGDKWLEEPAKSDPRDDYNRNHEDNYPDSRWPGKDVVSRNRNRGWPENVNDVPLQNEDGVLLQSHNSRWQDRPEPVPNHHLPRYHHPDQQPPNWYKHQDRRPEYRDYEYIGRGENPHQFWNQYRNQQVRPHRPDSYVQYSDYGNVASFEDENHEDIEETTTGPPHENEVEGVMTGRATTVSEPNTVSSDRPITETSGNITVETPKNTSSSSNKSSNHKVLFKKKTSLPDKSLTSAILPLAFGLLITVLLLLLVGCRLRQVNRRLRYGRLKTNVAEADYLINGMYL